MNNKVMVRNVICDDMKDLWVWVNDSLTRDMFRKNHYITWEEHCGWFYKMMKNNGIVLYIGMDSNGNKIGNVRFDRREDYIYEVSLNVNPLFRGQGLGKDLLQESVSYLIKQRRIDKLFAMVKKVNIASQKTFEKNGFFNVPLINRYPGTEEFNSNNEIYYEMDIPDA